MLVRDGSSRYYCPHLAHGANGKFFTFAEANGDYELKEGDVSALIEAAAKDVLSGKITIDVAVRDLAKRTNRTTAQIREALNIMTETIEQKDAEKAEQDVAVKAARVRKAPAPKPAKAPATPRAKAAHATGEQFAAARDALGLTNKQAAEACGEAEANGLPKMGKSATYVYILTHEGASADLLAKFEVALKQYAKRNKIKAPKPVAAVEEEAAE